MEEVAFITSQANLWEQSEFQARGRTKPLRQKQKKASAEPRFRKVRKG